MSEIPSAPHPATSPDPGPAPQPVRTAVALVWVLLALALVGFVVVLLTENRDALQQPLPGQSGVSPEVAAGLRTFAVVTGGIFVLLYSTLFAVMAAQLRAGRTWPRTALIVIAGLSLVGVVLASGAEVLVDADPRFDDVETSAVDLVVSLALRGVGLAVFVAAVVLLFRPASRAWLGAWKAVRADARRRRVAW